MTECALGYPLTQGYCNVARSSKQYVYSGTSDALVDGP